MLKITIPPKEFYDNLTGEFIQFKGAELSLEHSLISISKWEAKWHKPYMDPVPSHTKSVEEFYDYVRCMTLTTNVDPLVYRALTIDNIKEISAYINDPMTATWFSRKEGQAPSTKVVTSEVIYGWMVGLQIPFECQKWHLNRLLTLIRVCGENNSKEQKMSKSEAMAHHRRLNAARRKPRKR